MPPEKLKNKGIGEGSFTLHAEGAPWKREGETTAHPHPHPPPCHSWCRWILGIMGTENNRLDLKGTAVFSLCFYLFLNRQHIYMIQRIKKMVE